MHLRESVADVPYEAATFQRLQAELAQGLLDREANQLPIAPGTLSTPPRSLIDLSDAERSELQAMGEAALRNGRIGVVILNGGMATRFGGGAKGVVPVVPDHPLSSFLAVKLADIRQQATALSARIPTAVMNSFATRRATADHLRAIDWAGLTPSDRSTFVQSLLPRVLPDGTPLATIEGADEVEDELLYAAPGHGDTLPRLVDSGTWAAFMQRGVHHVMLSNVDNLGATLDPLLVGAHLQATASGASVSVEVVKRRDGDEGGCVAQLPGPPPQGAIIEGFRLPQGVDLSSYPHFNTNTLWFELSAIGLPAKIPLQWFAVRKQVQWPTGDLAVVQFERLIGQVTEFLPTAFIEVDRNRRFLPIKTRGDLHEASAQLRAHAVRVGVVSD